jgi:hypothetical protein
MQNLYIPKRTRSCPAYIKGHNCRISHIKIMEKSSKKFLQFTTRVVCICPLYQNFINNAEKILFAYGGHEAILSFRHCFIGNCKSAVICSGAKWYSALGERNFRLLFPKHHFFHNPHSSDYKMIPI